MKTGHIGSKIRKSVQHPTEKSFCCAPYLHGSGDEGDLCTRVQVLVDDESTGPLTGPHHATSLDQHQQLRRVGQGIWAQVDKTGWLIFCSIHLNIQENTSYHVLLTDILKISYIRRNVYFPNGVHLFFKLLSCFLIWFHRLLGDVTQSK